LNIDVLLNPLGPTYNEGPQEGSQSPFNAQALNNLILQVVDSDGTTVLATANATGTGGHEVIGNLALGAGTYFVRVSAALDQVQMYRLEVRDAQGVDDHGNSAGSATSIAVPSTTPGNIEVAGDVDFFAFNAIGGGEYTFET